MGPSINYVPLDFGNRSTMHLQVKMQVIYELHRDSMGSLLRGCSAFEEGASLSQAATALEMSLSATAGMPINQPTPENFDMHGNSNSADVENSVCSAPCTSHGPQKEVGTL